MKDIFKYTKNDMIEKEDEEMTRKIFKLHFDYQLKKRWANQLESEYNLPMSRIKQVPFFKRKWILVAASMLLFLVSTLLYQTMMQPDALHLADQHLSKKYDLNNIKKGGNIDEIRTRAIDNYNLNNYDKAIVLYQEVLTIGDGNIEDNFFLGLSYLYVNQSDKSIPFFKTSIDLPLSSDFRSKEIIHWYLSLAYIKAGELEEAKKELNIIIEAGGLRKSQAAELLEAM